MKRLKLYVNNKIMFIVLVLISILLIISCGKGQTPKPFPLVKHCPGITSVEYEGEEYPTVQIGDQCWLAKNLNIGTIITDSSNMLDNGVIEKYCYNNDTNNCNIYGGLYQWDEIMQYKTEEGSQGICPNGWHTPSNREFVDLFIYCDNFWSYLLDNQDSLWTVNNLFDEYANLSGFSALPAGETWKDEQFYYALHEFTGFWSSSEKDGEFVYGFGLPPIQELDGQLANKQAGLSVRCIKDQ